MGMLAKSDVVVRGAGVIGLSLALELQRRGARVQVVDAGGVLGAASGAAAGMLAAGDPHNPAALGELARLSAGMYPEFLGRLEGLSGRSVPFQTETAVQTLEDGGRVRLEERSIDPRMLMEALQVAARAAAVEVVREAVEAAGTLVVHATGAWFGRAMVRPVKGQMLRVRLAGLREVHRSGRVYVVPRTAGPQAGTALVGATVEEAGFDVGTREEDLRRLMEWGAELVPEVRGAERLEAWAGLRPGTVDGLPVMGRLGEREFVAAGHFRNGILLAPGTAAVMADLMEGKVPAVGLEAFSVRRF